jgi:cullin 1
MQHEHSDLDINFSVMVLGTNFWPLKPPEDIFIVPMDIQLTYDHFEKYYQTKHSGRNLTWLWNYSKNELRTNYLDQKYIFMTSTYQMAILLQYNNDDTLSLGEIAAVTNVGKDLLTQVLQPLVESRILINNETDQYDLNLSACYSLIRLYSSFSWAAPRFQVEEDSRKREPTNSGRSQGRIT